LADYQAETKGDELNDEAAPEEDDDALASRAYPAAVVATLLMPIVPYALSLAVHALRRGALVEQGHARQRQVARAFGCDERTVRRHQQRLAQGGLVAPGRPCGFPRGQPRLTKERIKPGPPPIFRLRPPPR
jgi:hypothetical protein